MKRSSSDLSSFPALPPVEHPHRPLGDGVVLEDVLAVVLELDILGAGCYNAGDVSVSALCFVILYCPSFGLLPYLFTLLINLHFFKDLLLKFLDGISWFLIG